MGLETDATGGPEGPPGNSSFKKFVSQLLLGTHPIARPLLLGGHQHGVEFTLDDGFTQFPQRRKQLVFTGKLDGRLALFELQRLVAVSQLYEDLPALVLPVPAVEADRHFLEANSVHDHAIVNRCRTTERSHFNSYTGLMNGTMRFVAEA